MAEPRRSAWSLATPMLLYSCFCLLVGDVLFGYDTASFGGILANPGFINQFGTYDPSTRKYAFTSLHTSLLSSLAFIGKFIGCLAAGPAIEWFGHRVVFFCLSVVSVIGVIIEITSAGTAAGSGRYAQFIVGRIIVYISVGLVEVDVTTYQAEIVPAPFRGLVVVSLQLFLNAGSLVATGVNRAFSTYTSHVGWREEAVAALRRLRPKTAEAESECEAEVQAIQEALHQHVEKAPWLELLRGSNLRRTMIVMAYYFFQQTTGQAFVSTYQTTFLKQNGFAAEAFTYPVINTALSFVAVIPAMYLVDKVGRRYSLLTTFLLQAFWIFLLAGLGEKSNKGPVMLNAIVASFILYWFSYNMGGASIPYLLGGEIPTAALREKTQALGTAWNVLWAFGSNFSIPYLISDLHFKIGWVFGSISLLAFIFTFFFLPETKGRALEEIDAIFATPYSPFRKGIPNFTDAERGVGQLEGEVEKGNAVSDNEGRSVKHAEQSSLEGTR
ncbi:hypothetical protein ONZ43_g6758 [Nemania bipapillata]|uniref:Uncharacterized protein n=1 Tax=Nemania bipapillata TaxID=110536 RepID=A0ACC2HWV1_9PEZI|nr:hypothetical protein ONZ43_g6758 [Nemania bipapillata]